MKFYNNILERSIKDMHEAYEIPLIIVHNHSPAYQFQDLPEPLSRIEQGNSKPICFWPEFDWHVKFARAITKSDKRMGFICVRPDERAKHPVFYRFDKNILMVHFPSVMMKRISGASCIEVSDSLIDFLIDTLRESRFLLIIMGVGTSFGRNIFYRVSNNPKINIEILGWATGDLPSIYSKTMLANLLFSYGFKDRLRFIKHTLFRIVEIRKVKTLYKALSHIWIPTVESRNHWKEVVDCPISFAPGGYGYDESLWKPGDKILARKALNLPLDVPVVLSSSVLIPKKKLDDLIQACLIVKKRIGELKLIISGYGESSEKQKLQNIAKKLDFDEQVLFTDYVTEEDLVRYYQAADVFVHLSAVEGGPVSAMQALVTNTPLVMTPVGCVGELLQISNLGRLFPVGDIFACAEMILDAIKDKKLPNTSEIAKRLYSWEVRGSAMAKDIETVWKDQKV